MVILVPHNCVGSVENSNMDDPDTQTQDHCKYTEMSDFSRICFVSQVLLFLVALVSLTIGLTFGYNESMMLNEVAQNSNSGILNVDCFSELIGDG